MELPGKSDGNRKRRRHRRNSQQEQKVRYHRSSHLVSLRVQVQLVQTQLDLLSGGSGALWQQHAKVMHEILRQEQRQPMKGDPCFNQHADEARADESSDATCVRNHRGPDITAQLRRTPTGQSEAYCLQPPGQQGADRGAGDVFMLLQEQRVLEGAEDKAEALCPAVPP